MLLVLSTCFVSLLQLEIHHQHQHKHVLTALLLAQSQISVLRSLYGRYTVTGCSDWYMAHCCIG